MPIAAVINLPREFAGKADLNVKEMPQRGGGHHRGEENVE
jgi:hypothetical protein